MSMTEEDGCGSYKWHLPGPSRIREPASTLRASTVADQMITKCAVVTGSNKGIGLEICKQLGSRGITVVLTARNQKLGLEAAEKLKECGLSDTIVFHQLDVTDAASIASLAEFVKTQFGKLDILVNNAGIGGNIIDTEAIKAYDFTDIENLYNIWPKVMTENYELSEECVKTNYYGSLLTTQALLPLLHLSDSPKIVNVSSHMGLLKQIPGERIKDVLRDGSLTEEKIDELLTEFLKDYREGMLEAKEWPSFLSAYAMSKAALNGYTRLLAKRYPKICINCVSPGFVKTDINCNTGMFAAEQGAAYAVKLALLPNGGPTGLFFSLAEPASFEG